MKSRSSFIKKKINGKATLHHISCNYNCETHCHNMEAKSASGMTRIHGENKLQTMLLKHTHIRVQCLAHEVPELCMSDHLKFDLTFCSFPQHPYVTVRESRQRLLIFKKGEGCFDSLSTESLSCSVHLYLLKLLMYLRLYFN